MARISGIDLPKGKRIDVALAYIYGIGKFLSEKILTDLNIPFNTRVKDITETQANQINTYIASNSIKVEGDLRREVQQNIRRLIDIGSYRGYRHKRNLPVHGQRTKTNARTRRGKRKTVGAAKAVKKPAAAPAVAAK